MGVTEDQANQAVNDCMQAFEPRDRPPPLIQPGGGGNPATCELYRAELDRMAPRDVTLGAYAFDREEVSTADYRACVAAGACTLDPLIDGDERYIRDNGPMVNVTWDEAQAFCHWRGG